MPNKAVVGAAEKLESKINAWLQDHLIPRLASVFGEKCSAREAECKVTRPRGSFFQSDTFFASIRFPGSSATEWLIIVKLPNQDEIVRSYHNFTDLFDNEILFYQRIADSESEEYPKCYLAGVDQVFEKVLVLENVSPRGYFICSNNINIGMDYVLAGLQTIARFHSNTYAMKEEMPEKFYQIVKDIKSVRYDKDNLSVSLVECVNDRILRVLKGLQARGCDSEFTKQVENLFKDTYHNILMKCVEPVEPLATIIHGDCTQNNMMFQKVGTDGFKAMLIDFQLMMYTSPALDVSVWIYMCLTREDIKAHSKSLFNAYHDALRKSLEERNVWSPDKYSREAFWQDYKERAMFGYITAAYFLPIMTAFADNNDLLQLDDETIQKAGIDGGGEVLTNALVDMLLDAREAGLLDFYLSNDNAEVCLRE